MAARDERLLVGRGHNLARLQGGENRAQGDHAAGGNHNEIHVGPRREGLQSLGAADKLRAGREFQPRGCVRVGQGDRGGPEQPSLFLEDAGLRGGGEGHNPEVGRIPGENVDGLPADRPAGPEQCHSDRRAATLAAASAATPLPSRKPHVSEPGRSRRSPRWVPRI